MRTVILTALLCLVLMPPARAASFDRGGGVTGTYAMQGGEVRVQEADGKIKFIVDATYDANVGQVGARLRSPATPRVTTDQDNDCALAFKFSSETLVVGKDGTCGMGLNVSGSGTYKRVSRAAPAFDD